MTPKSLHWMITEAKHRNTSHSEVFNIIFLVLLIASEIVVSGIFIRYIDNENKINLTSIINLSVWQECLGRARQVDMPDSVIHDLYGVIMENYSNPVQEFEDLQLSMALALNDQLESLMDVDIDVLGSIIEYNLVDWEMPASFRLTLINPSEGSIISESDHLTDNHKYHCVKNVYLDKGGDRMLAVEYDMIGPRRAFMRKFLWPMLLLNVMILVLMAVTLVLSRVKRGYERKLSDFVNIVAHNMKNPLAVAYSAAETLQSLDNVTDDALASRLVGINLNHLKELDHRVDDVLYEVKKLSIHNISREVVPVLPVILDIQKEYELRGVQVQMTIDVATSHSILCNDKEHLTATIRNLFDNSVKYSRGLPEVSVRSKQTDKDHLSIIVSDHGIGFTRDDLHKAFAKYRRGERADALSSAGFGMGLYYVKRVSDLNGWKVSIDSKAGYGATVTIGKMQMAKTI